MCFWLSLHGQVIYWYTLHVIYTALRADLLVGTFGICSSRGDCHMSYVTDAGKCLSKDNVWELLYTYAWINVPLREVFYPAHLSSKAISTDVRQVFKFPQLASCEPLTHNLHVFLLCPV